MPPGLTVVQRSGVFQGWSGGTGDSGSLFSVFHMDPMRSAAIPTQQSRRPSGPKISSRT